ncbi:MAG: hypothetical protein C4527_13775 [Candidatus Omnitrophota bacterium]|jgi:hypothetical protein|nr:MAG: hypothetical protein C4527_13775 [Candidatus Omnitrophota bacterium]
MKSSTNSFRLILVLLVAVSSCGCLRNREQSIDVEVEQSKNEPSTEFSESFIVSSAEDLSHALEAHCHEIIITGELAAGMMDELEEIMKKHGYDLDDLVEDSAIMLTGTALELLISYFVGGSVTGFPLVGALVGGGIVLLKYSGIFDSELEDILDKYKVNKYVRDEDRNRCEIILHRIE